MQSMEFSRPEYWSGLSLLQKDKVREVTIERDPDYKIDPDYKLDPD